jgi:hypothetical protein
MTPEQLVQRLQTALPTELKSVVLYGSATAGDFVDGRSNVNLLVIAERLGPGELDRMAPALSDWLAAGQEVPRLFTAAELAASADAFPIELADMRQSRRTLFGGDLLADVTIDPAHLRLQLERELQGKLMLLRRQYLQASGDDARLSNLMIWSLSTFLVLFRAGLRLFRPDPPMVKLEALDELSRHLKFDPQPFRTVYEWKTSGRLPSGCTVATVFEDYLKAVEQVVHLIDRHLHVSASST